MTPPRVLRKTYRALIPRSSLVDRALVGVYERFDPSSSKPRDQWSRTAMYQAVDRKLSELDPGRLDALEISGTNYRDKPWRSYSELHYPAFDLCDPPDELSPQADIVLCDQVLEHVRDPFAAARTLFDLCRPGGWCFVATPFLYRIHAAPDDFWRFTPHGLAQVLGEAGFDDIDAQWWGNKACIKACLTGDPIYRGWRSLRSPDHALPVVVWAFARKNSS